MSRFVKLKDVNKQMYKKVDLLGVVVEFSIPRHSKGSDFVAVLKIVDESQQDPELCLNIFGTDPFELPHIKSCGDLIILNRVQITAHDGKTYAVFRKKFSSFSLFSGYPSTNFNSYQPRDVTCLQLDRRPIHQLRTWLRHLNFDAASLVEENDFPLFTLKDIKEQGYFDLVCKIVHMAEFDDEWILYVWDGNDTPPLSFNTRLDVEHNRLPLQIEPSPLPQELAHRLNRAGSILRITVDGTYETLDQHFSGTGAWVRLRNITCRSHAGLWYGMFTPSSKIRLLADTNKIVQERKRNYKERLKETGRCPMWCDQSFCSLTEFRFPEGTHYADGPVGSLMDVVASSQTNVMFKCIVRVVAVYPSQVEDICSPNGSKKYKLRLILEDPTTRIDASICWFSFFGGDLPLHILGMKLKKLLGEGLELCIENGHCEYVRHPPWIWCALTFKDSSSSNSETRRQFQIIHTRLVA